MTRGIAGLALLLAAAFIGVAAWGCARGFDFIDGGAYYLMYKYPQDVVDIQTSYQLIGRAFFLAVGQNIVAFRCVSWILLLASALVFHLGLLRHLRSLRPDVKLGGGAQACLFVALMVSSAMVYAAAPVALSYNSLNTICLLAELGLLLAATGRLSGDKPTAWPAWAELFATCLIVAAQLFIKPTTSLIFFGAMVGFCLASPLISLRIKARIAGILLAGAGLGLAGFAVFLGSWPAFTRRLGNLVGIAQNAAYTHALLTRTAAELASQAEMSWGDLRWPLALLLFVSLGLWTTRRRGPWSRPAALIGGACLGAAWLTEAVHHDLWQAAHDYFARAAVARFYIGADFLAAAMLALSPPGPAPPPGDRRGQAHWAMLWAILMFLPYAGSFGTTNPIYLNAAFQAPCWVAALGLALFGLSRRWRCPPILHWGLLPVAAFATAQFVNGYVFHPYALLTGLGEQDTPTRVGAPATTLLLDPPTSRFIRDARRILDAHGFKPGDDIFAFFNLPGLVFAVGGRSPVIPWYFGRIYVHDRIEESYMRAVGAGRRRHAWIITQADAPRFREHYLRGGLDFPANYALIGELTNPVTHMDVKIWMPRPAAPR